MHLRRFWMALLCLGALTMLGLQSLTAEATAASPRMEYVEVAPADHAVPNGKLAIEQGGKVYIPLANKEGSPSTPTSTGTPTEEPTGEPSPTPTATAIVADLYVDDTNTTGNEDGSAQRPFASIQAAINAAGSEAIAIAVAAGTYDENILIQEKTVHLYGGFVGGTLADYTAGTAGNFSDRNPTANVSHLQGDRTDSVVTMIEAGSSTVDGFRITNGTRTLTYEYGDQGGGFYVYGGSPTISNNLIENNDSRTSPPSDKEPFGGGIFATASDIKILNNIIRNNISGRGGGIAISGGTVTIRGNTVQDNRGVGTLNGDHGGGLYIASPNAEISHNLIIGNETGEDAGFGWGGGIIIFGEGSFAHLSYNEITDNYAPSIGSGVFIDEGARATIEHELIHNNRCTADQTYGGVGLYVDGNTDLMLTSRVTVIHSTIASNNCASTQGGNGLYVDFYAEVTIINSIFWDNGDDFLLVDSTSKLTVTYSTSQEEIEGVGNLISDPLFANATQQDYHLKSTAGRWDPTASGGNGGWVVDAVHSPAIDAADPAAAFANEPAPNGSRANMGVFGNTGEASKSSE